MSLSAGQAKTVQDKQQPLPSTSAHVTPMASVGQHEVRTVQDKQQPLPHAMQKRTCHIHGIWWST